MMLYLIKSELLRIFRSSVSTRKSGNLLKRHFFKILIILSIIYAPYIFKDEISKPIEEGKTVAISNLKDALSFVQESTLYKSILNNLNTQKEK